MWAGIILLGLLGYSLNLAFGAVERRACGWHASTRRGEA
jgi:ABC-type nitrate/sulfonate/bicarbonate transport system permease component